MFLSYVEMTYLCWSECFSFSVQACRWLYLLDMDHLRRRVSGYLCEAEPLASSSISLPYGIIWSGIFCSYYQSIRKHILKWFIHAALLAPFLLQALIEEFTAQFYADDLQIRRRFSRIIKSDCLMLIVNLINTEDAHLHIKCLELMNRSV